MKRLFLLFIFFPLIAFTQLKDIKIIMPKDFGFSYSDFAQFLPGEEYFAVCSNALTVIHTETSEVIDEIDLPYLAKNLSVNPKGNLLMVCAGNELLVYSFVNQQLKLFYKTNTSELIKGLPNSEYYGSLQISGCFFTGNENKAYVSIGAFSLVFDLDSKKVITSHSFAITDYMYHAVPFIKKQEVILAKTTGSVTSIIKQSLSNLTQTTTLLEDIASVSKLKIRDSLLFAFTGDNFFALNLETGKIGYEIMMPKHLTGYYNTTQQQYLRKPRALSTPDTKNFVNEYVYDMDLLPGTSQVAFSTMKGIKFIDIKTSALLKSIDGIFVSLKFSSEGKRIVTNGYTPYKALRVYNPKNMQLLSERPAMDNPIYFADISPNKRWLYTKGNVSAFIWDLNNFSKYVEIKDASGKDSASVYNLFFLNDTEVVGNSGKAYPNFNLSIYNLNKKQYTRTLKKNVTAAACGFMNGEFYYADYTSLHIINLKTMSEEKYDGLYSMAANNLYKIISFTKDLVFVPGGGNYKIVNRHSKKTEYESQTWSMTAPVLISEDSRYVITSAQINKKKKIGGNEIEMPTNAIVRIDMASKKIINDYAESYFPYDFKIKNNGKTIGIWYIKYDIANYNNEFKETVYSEYETESGKEIISKSLAKTPDILPFHATSDKGDYFAICDATGKQFKIFNGSAEEIIDLSESNILMPKCFFMEEIGKLIVTGSNTSLATLIDLKQKKIIGQIANAVNDNFFLITPELYYMGSKDFIKNMRFKYNSEIFSFEQFDAYLNQPHKVLRAFGSNDSVLIKAYETAYLKRMKVLGIKPGSKINFSSIPQFQFIKLQEQSAGNIQFSLSINKGAGKLKQLLIFNNGSLVHSEFIKDEYSAHFEKNITFESTSGINRFEFIVKDENGLESPRTSRLYNNTTIVKPNLFLVVIASEKFKDTRFDLAYAVKDAGDMAKNMSNSKSFNKIEIKKLFNQSFTSDSVKQLKGFFDKAGINDVVMIFFAGHGYLDEDLSYYFPSYYTDFTDPKINAVAYKEFEKLFQQMKPIRKLMFIDACFSGEVDDDIFTDDAGEEEKKKKDGRDIRLAGKTFAQTTAMEMAKVVFSDLRQNSGATIISSAGGTEAAFEGEKWNNGLFTHCLLEGLSNYKADLNHDKKITLSELQKFVAEEVNSLSGGKQTPTYRLENTMLDYQLWE